MSVIDFSRRLNDLMLSEKVSRRALSNKTGLQRKSMLETVIKLSAFFGVSIEQIISSNPHLNYGDLQQGVGKFNIRFGEFPPEGLYYYAHKRANILTKEQAKKLVDELLD